MRFERVDKENIDILFNLNKELAVCEGQASLFVAKKSEYFNAFCAPNPLAEAFLIYKGDFLVGFFIYFKKFATYLASKTLFIEDLYLREAYITKEDIFAVLEFLEELSKNSDCSRIEMRVLKRYSVDIRLIKEFGFKKIDKWNVYRIRK